MTTTIQYMKEWQEALQNEIIHLKKYGSNKLTVMNGRLLTNDGSFTYYFDTSISVRIPVGSSIRLEWGSMMKSGRILSSEGRGIIISLEQSFGDLIPEAYLIHDPWELLEQLIQRFDEIKKSKQKRIRVKKLMDPSMPAKHPIEKITSNVHELMLRSKYNPITFVWGPPGTGKTYTLARVAANKYFQDKQVLLLSHSNQAVDVLLSEISTFIKKKKRFQEGDVLRYGANVGDALATHDALTTNQLIKKREPGLAENKDILIEERRKLKQDLARSFSKRDSSHLLDLEIKIARALEKIRQKEIEFVKEASVVGTTLAKAASDPSIYEREFDIVILDEASMAYIPQIAFAATLGKRIIICGDFKQLPPIASSRDSIVTKWLKEDIFHRTGIVDRVKVGELHPHLFLLKEQRRMHPDISAFTNQYIYQSLVGDHESVRTCHNRIVEQSPFPMQAAVFVDTSFMGEYCINDQRSNSRLNLWQLLLSFQLIHESYVGGARSIGYVTPYRAQANLMGLLLEDLYEKELQSADIIAATVHRFQGSERDVMIFDTVDSNPQDRAGMLLTGRDSERLINVAITRTKGKFIHVSDREFIHSHVYQSKTLRKLILHQEKQKQIVKPKAIGSWIKHQHPRLQWTHARKLEWIFQDIQTARSSIIISLPEQTVLMDDWLDIIKNRRNRVKLSIISNDSWEKLQPNQWIKKSLSFPFVLIDSRVLWLGLPLEGTKGVLPPHVAVRLDSEKLAEYLIGEFQVGE
jgi:superfamily I DNA and/or RNA helicase